MQLKYEYRLAKFQSGHFHGCGPRYPSRKAAYQALPEVNKTRIEKGLDPCTHLVELIARESEAQAGNLRHCKPEPLVGIEPTPKGDRSPRVTYEYRLAKYKNGYFHGCGPRYESKEAAREAASEVNEQRIAKGMEPCTHIAEIAVPTSKWTRNDGYFELEPL